MPIENSRDMINKQYGARKEREDMLQSVPLEQPRGTPTGEVAPAQAAPQGAPPDGGGEAALAPDELPNTRPIDPQAYNKGIVFAALKSMRAVATPEIESLIEEFIEIEEGSNFADDRGAAESYVPDNGVGIQPADSQNTTEEDRVPGADQNFAGEPAQEELLDTL